MKIKKFTAPTLQEGKILVRKELGDDAVVLSTRSVRNKEDNSQAIEIVAAVDGNKSPAIRKRLRLPSGANDNIEEKGDLDNSILMENNSQLLRELSGLKNMISEISDSVKYKYSGSLGPTFGRLFKELQKADISEDYALEIIGKISSEKADINFYDAYNKARELLTNNIEVLPPVKKSDKRKIAAFIGPTGCGKTTSLVKLAIVIKLIIKANVLLVSADIHKVGGADQLQSYASIAGIPFKAVYTPDEMEALITSEQERDFILIDTTGRSYSNRTHMEGLKEILEKVNHDFLYLVQSCTTGLNTLLKSISEYKKLMPNALILTKVDETAGMGAVLEALRKESLPLAYFTNGQKIPDDIEPANKEYLSKIVLPDINEEIIR